ncbi:Coq4 family protein [Litorimonas sp. RW-G-Af-16]|uniref:Coq4 family protein n=1 Tax=Litorimonas sp. RW-G-Af-16 TaxID=3241168 RepID=UPI00390C4254
MTNRDYTYDKSTRKPIRPLKALKHFRNLMADKEDTSQVFHIINELNGDNFQKFFCRFANSPEGRKHIEAGLFLPTMLDDHEKIRKLPEGTVGRAYVEFMESQGLTAQGLVDEYESFDSKARDKWSPEMITFGNRLRDTHDLVHVMTGYSRDALGEACVLGLSYSQHGGRGLTFIAHMAGWEVKKSAPKGAPVMRAVREGHKIGKTATDLVYLDIEALLAMDLEAARAKYGYITPETYFKVHDCMRAAGMDPYAFIGGEAALA